MARNRKKTYTPYFCSLNITGDGIKQDKINRLVKYARQVGLLDNVQKTEIMNIPANLILNQNITINDEQLFTYLWSVISSEDGSKANTKSRIDKVRVAFNSLQIFGNPRDLL